MNLRMKLKLLLPLLLILSCSGPKNDSDIISMKEPLEERAVSPGELIAGFDSPAVIIAAENGYRENILMLQYLVPVLYEKGIRDMGVWFCDALYQETVNRIILSEEQDKELADELLRLSYPDQNYAEYRNFILYVQHFNSNLNDEEPRFFLHGLSLTGIPNLATGQELLEEYAPIVFFLPRDIADLWLNNIRYSQKTANGMEQGSLQAVLIHSPVWDKNRRYLQLPYDGLMEAGMQETIPYFHYGALTGTDLTLLPGFPDRLYQGLLYYGPADQYSTLTILDDFLETEEAPVLYHRYPGRLPHWPNSRIIRRLEKISRQRIKRLEKKLRKLHNSVN